MKNRTFKTKPLKSNKIVITVPKPVRRKRFAPASQAHGQKGYDRKALTKEMRAIDGWCDKHFGKD